MSDSDAPATSRWSPAELTPGYFPAVMATGIVSVGALLTGHGILAAVLFWCAIVLYAVLIVLTGWRLIAHRDRVVADFRSPSRAFVFFTFIAATNVIATGGFLGTGRSDFARALLIVSVLAWLILGYVIPWTAVLGSSHRPMLDSANGTWFIWVVASQSVAVVAAGLDPPLDERFRDVLSVLAVTAWSIGVILYGACAIFVTLRIMLYRLDRRTSTRRTG